MNIHRNTTTITRLASKILCNTVQRDFTAFSRTAALVPMNHGRNDLLKPSSFTVVPTKAMQTKREVEKLCQDCYFVWRESRKFVYCKKHPSHNQQTRIPKDKEQFIIVQKTHGRIRPW